MQEWSYSSRGQDRVGLSEQDLLQLSNRFLVVLIYRLLF